MKRLLRVAILANVSRRFDRRIIQGITRYAREAGDWDLYVEEQPLKGHSAADRWSVDGLLVAFDDREKAQAVAGVRIPVVGFGGGHGWYEPKSHIPYYATDNEAIGRLAADHLLECGFSRLACYGSRPTRTHHWTEDRIRAFRRRAEERGAVCSIFRARNPTAGQWDTLQRELAAWLDGIEKPVGLLACTDLRARHVLQVCRVQGIRVPDDVAVVGVDNDEMLCEMTTPPLSSIEQGSLRIGYEAAAMLARRMRGEKPSPIRHFIPPESLVARQSTDVVACGDPELAAALHFIRRHACDPIRVADVLEVVQVCRSTLERQFFDALGRTIHLEIERVQIERAKHLLSRTSLLVKQIAKRCGFRYGHYLTTVFRRCTGQSPLEYRRSQERSVEVRRERNANERSEHATIGEQGGDHHRRGPGHRTGRRAGLRARGGESDRGRNRRRPRTRS
jgi:LacI family transcriptional regulator